MSVITQGLESRKHDKHIMLGTNYVVESIAQTKSAVFSWNKHGYHHKALCSIAYENRERKNEWPPSNLCRYVNFISITKNKIMNRYNHNYTKISLPLYTILLSTWTDRFKSRNAGAVCHRINSRFSVNSTETATFHLPCWGATSETLYISGVISVNQSPGNNVCPKN